MVVVRFSGSRRGGRVKARRYSRWLCRCMRRWCWMEDANARGEEKGGRRKRRRRVLVWAGGRCESEMKRKTMGSLI